MNDPRRDTALKVLAEAKAALQKNTDSLARVPPLEAAVSEAEAAYADDATEERWSALLEARARLAPLDVPKARRPGLLAALTAATAALTALEREHATERERAEAAAELPSVLARVGVARYAPAFARLTAALAAADDAAAELAAAAAGEHLDLALASKLSQKLGRPLMVLPHKAPASALTYAWQAAERHRGGQLSSLAALGIPRPTEAHYVRDEVLQGAIAAELAK